MSGFGDVPAKSVIVTVLDAESPWASWTVYVPVYVLASGFGFENMADVAAEAILYVPPSSVAPEVRPRSKLSSLMVNVTRRSESAVLASATWSANSSVAPAGYVAVVEIGVAVGCVFRTSSVMLANALAVPSDTSYGMV